MPQLFVTVVTFIAAVACRKCCNKGTDTGINFDIHEVARLLAALELPLYEKCLCYIYILEHCELNGPVKVKACDLEHPEFKHATPVLSAASPFDKRK